MFIHSYKYYYHLWRQKPKISKLERTFLLIILVLVIGVGFISAVIFYQYKKETPVRAQKEYLESVSSGFHTISQSQQELLDLFNVAGVKIESTDTYKESSASPQGFYIAQDYLDKTIAAIENLKQNINFQKDQIFTKPVPFPLLDLKNNIVSYYDQSFKFLNDLLEKYRFSKKFLQAVGPSFYVTSLSDESLWQARDSRKITAYYQDLKKQADESLEKLGRLEPPPEFQNEFKTQIAYFELAVKTADQILQLLSQSDDPNIENATQIEKAYQVLTGARRENEDFSQKIIQSRQNLTLPKENYQRFAPVKYQENLIANQVNELFANQPQTGNIALPSFINKLFKI